MKFCGLNEFNTKSRTNEKYIINSSVSQTEDY